MSLARRRIWDLGDPSGPAEIEGHTVHVGEMLERDPARYVAELPEGVRPGPKSGENRIRHW